MNMKECLSLISSVHYFQGVLSSLDQNGSFVLTKQDASKLRLIIQHLPVSVSIVEDSKLKHTPQTRD
jgi:hypothetical protein